MAAVSVPVIQYQRGCYGQGQRSSSHLAAPATPPCDQELLWQEPGVCWVCFSQLSAACGVTTGARVARRGTRGQAGGGSEGLASLSELCDS